MFRCVCISEPLAACKPIECMHAIDQSASCDFCSARTTELSGRIWQTRLAWHVMQGSHHVCRHTCLSELPKSRCCVLTIVDALMMSSICRILLNDDVIEENATSTCATCTHYCRTEIELNPPVPQNEYCYRYPSGCSPVCPFKCVSIFVAGNVPRAHPAGCCGTATGSRAPDLHVRFDSCKHNQCQDRTADLESFIASHRLRCRKYIMTMAQLAEHTNTWLCACLLFTMQ